MFVENEKVWVQDKFKKTWSEATIVKKLNLPRCYLIRDKRGRELRRNVIFLRKNRTLSLELDEESEEENDEHIREKACDKKEKNNTSVKTTRLGRRINKPNRYGY